MSSITQHHHIAAVICFEPYDTLAFSRLVYVFVYTALQRHADHLFLSANIPIYYGRFAARSDTLTVCGAHKIKYIYYRGSKNNKYLQNIKYVSLWRIKH